MVLATYKYIIDDIVVAELALWRVPRSREGVWRDVQKRTAAGICDVEGGNGNYSGSMWAGVKLESRHTTGLVAEKKRALLGPAVDGPHASVRQSQPAWSALCRVRRRRGCSRRGPMRPEEAAEVVVVPRAVYSLCELRRGSGCDGDGGRGVARDG